MRVLTLCLAIGIMLTAACISGSDSGGTGGAAGGALPLAGQTAGGATSLGGTTGSSIPPTGACASLTCLNPLVALLYNSACVVSATDTCTEQTNASTYTQSACFSNGVKVQMDDTTMTMTVKSGSFICYSVVLGTAYVVKNGSGATVATMSTDGTTVTCPGGTPTVIDATCGSSSAVSSGAMPDTSICTTGACTF